MSFWKSKKGVNGKTVFHQAGNSRGRGPRRLKRGVAVLGRPTARKKELAWPLTQQGASRALPSKEQSVTVIVK